MASLAIFAGMMFLTVLLVGPAAWLLSVLRFVPDFFVYCLALCAIALGIWWIFLPIGIIQFAGMAPVILGFVAINTRVECNSKRGKDE